MSDYHVLFLSFCIVNHTTSYISRHIRNWTKAFAITMKFILAARMWTIYLSPVDWHRVKMLTQIVPSVPLCSNVPASRQCHTISTVNCTHPHQLAHNNKTSSHASQTRADWGNHAKILYSSLWRREIVINCLLDDNKLLLNFFPI